MKLTSLLVEWLISGVRSIRTNHLLVLADSDTLSLDNLDVLKARENLMLDHELGDHGELSSLLDLEWLVLQGGFGSLGGEVNGHWWAAGSLQGEGENDALAWIIWVGDGWSGGKTKGGLVALKRLIVGIYGQLALLPKSGICPAQSSWSSSFVPGRDQSVTCICPGP